MRKTALSLFPCLFTKFVSNVKVYQCLRPILMYSFRLSIKTFWKKITNYNLYIFVKYEGGIREGKEVGGGK